MIVFIEVLIIVMIGIYVGVFQNRKRKKHEQESVEIQPLTSLQKQALTKYFVNADETIVSSWEIHILKNLLQMEN